MSWRLTVRSEKEGRQLNKKGRHCRPFLLFLLLTVNYQRPTLLLTDLGK
jgi:hypothetical protein